MSHKIANSAIGTDQIANESVTQEKLAPGVGGGGPGFVICDFCTIADLQLRYNISNTTNHNFDKANITGADLSNTDFSGSTFRNAVALSSSWGGGNLSNTDFTNAKFYQEFTSPSSFANANLTNANFTNAHLGGANMSGATTTGVTWSNTICPDGTNSNDNGNTCEGHL